MIYIKVRKQVSQVSQVVTLSPIKQEKALLGQIVSTPNSSATFRKSCTTFGRRNYLLRLSQIFKNQCYLTRSEHMLGSTIVRFAECFGEFLVGPDPGGQAVECRFLTDVGSIGLCQLALVIGSYSVFHLMSYELSVIICIPASRCFSLCKDTQNQRDKQHKKSRNVIGFPACFTNVIFPFPGCCIFVVSSGRQEIKCHSE